MKFQIKKKLKYNKFQRRNIRATKIQIMKGNDHYQRKKKKIKFKKTILYLMLTIIRLKELFYVVSKLLFFNLIKVPKTTELIKKSAADSIDNRKVTQDLEK